MLEQAKNKETIAVTVDYTVDCMYGCVIKIV
jgi:hypothetical protein